MDVVRDSSHWNIEQFVTHAADAVAAEQFDLAHSLCLLGVTHFPDSARLLTLLGWVFARTSDFANAEATFRHALSHEDANVDALAGLAAVLARIGKFSDAEAPYQKALALRPDNADTWFNYGCTLLALRRLDESIDAFMRAATFDEQMADARLNLASAFGQMGRWDESLAEARHALRLEPHSWQARLLAATSQLALGNFAVGWDDYEARIESQRYYTDLLGLPTWQGPSDHRPSILVVPEQGVGTQIMFASCLADLAAHVPRIALGCDPRLIALFRRSFPFVEIVAAGALPLLATSGEFGCYAMAGSLPRYFRRARRDFSGASYLLPEPNASQRWKKRLAALGPGTTIGISWRGGAHAPDALHRSILPTDWQAVLELPNIHWINLQYDALSAEIESWKHLTNGRFNSFEGVDLRHDFENLSGLVSQLDLVISAVNSTVHLAGGLGTPTWTLVPQGGEWRWLASGEECIWHRSVHLFRQDRFGKWSDVIARIRRQLSVASRAAA